MQASCAVRPAETKSHTKFADNNFHQFFAATRSAHGRGEIVRICSRANERAISDASGKFCVRAPGRCRGREISFGVTGDGANRITLGQPAFPVPTMPDRRSSLRDRSAENQRCRRKTRPRGQPKNWCCVVTAVPARG